VRLPTETQGVALGYRIAPFQGVSPLQCRPSTLRGILSDLPT